MLVSGTAKGMQVMLWEVEQKSPAYGLKMNYDICEKVIMNARRYPNFRSGRPVPRVDSATYLGCEFNSGERRPAAFGRAWGHGDGWDFCGSMRIDRVDAR